MAHLEIYFLSRIKRKEKRTNRYLSNGIFFASSATLIQSPIIEYALYRRRNAT
jgi:hypothetical protein